VVFPHTTSDATSARLDGWSAGGNLWPYNGGSPSTVAGPRRGVVAVVRTLTTFRWPGETATAIMGWVSSAGQVDVAAGETDAPFAIVAAATAVLVLTLLAALATLGRTTDLRLILAMSAVLGGSALMAASMPLVEVARTRRSLLVLQVLGLITCSMMYVTIGSWTPS
jgi:hypothetical protein